MVALLSVSPPRMTVTEAAPDAAKRTTTWQRLLPRRLLHVAIRNSLRSAVESCSIAAQMLRNVQVLQQHVRLFFQSEAQSSYLQLRALAVEML